ncbi:MAG: hypothetical protein ACOX5F_08930 [Anaerovoracaceae bacterium]|jgi:hypothetical protein
MDEKMRNDETTQNNTEPKVNVDTTEKSTDKVPGESAATISLVLGIISVLCWFFGYSSIISIVLGIIGLVQSSNSKKAGFNGGTRKAGFILSLIGLIGGGLIFVACVACIGLMGTAGILEAL